MKLKRDTKFWEESSCCFKIGVRSLTKFDPSSQKSQKFPLNELLVSKVYIVWPKKVQRDNISWNWRGLQNLERIWLVVSKLVQGIPQIWTWLLKSLKDFHFRGLLYSKLCIVWAKKVERSYLSWNWTGMQNLERNQVGVSKLA